MMQKWRIADARNFQMGFQLIFLIYGIIFLQWKANWLACTVTLISGTVFQYSIDIIRSKKWMLPATWWKTQGWKSVFISSLSLCLLLKTNSLAINFLASGIAILSKYIFKYNNKHIFNPSALGIAVSVLFTGQAWISPGQWGSHAVLFFGIISLGVIVVTRVQKLDVSLTFIGLYAALVFARQVVYLGWPLDYFFQTISTGSILLFTFFMISDPRTTPNHQIGRVIWAGIIAFFSFYLGSFHFVNGAPIWVLVFLQPLVPLINYLFKDKNFEWFPSTFQQNSLNTSAASKLLYSNMLSKKINHE